MFLGEGNQSRLVHQRILFRVTVVDMLEVDLTDRGVSKLVVFVDDISHEVQLLVDLEQIDVLFHLLLDQSHSSQSLVEVIAEDSCRKRQKISQQNFSLVHVIGITELINFLLGLFLPAPR